MARTRRKKESTADFIKRRNKMERQEKEKGGNMELRWNRPPKDAPIEDSTAYNTYVAN